MGYGNLGSAFKDKGDLEKAELNYKKVIHIITELNSEGQDVAIVYNNLARINYAKNEYQLAIQNYRRAVEIGRKSMPRLHPLLNLVLNNFSEFENELGLMFADEDNHQKALDYFQSAYEHSKEAENKDNMLTILVNIVSVLKNSGSCDSINPYIDESIKLAKNLNKARVGFKIYLSKASCLKKLNKTEEANMIFKVLLKNAIEWKAQDLIIDLEREGLKLTEAEKQMVQKIKN